MMKIKENRQENLENSHVENVKFKTLFLFKENYLSENQVDSRYILFFFLFTATASLQFDFFESIIAFLLFSGVLIYKYKEKQKKMYLFTFLLVFSFFCFLFTLFIKSLYYKQGFYFIDVKENFFFALEYVLHLTLLGIIGLCLFVWLNAKEYAYAVTWFCSFLSKKHAWKVGLVTLLVLRYFSSLGLSAKELKISIEYRLRKEKSYTKKVSLYMLNLFALLADKNYELAVAVFARKMNTQEAFEKKWEKLPFLGFNFFKRYSIPLFLFFFSLSFLMF